AGVPGPCRPKNARACSALRSVLSTTAAQLHAVMITEKDCIKWATSIRRVGFFLDESGPQQLVDPALEGSPAIVEPIDRTRQLDETRPELTVALADSQSVFHVPQSLIHRAQLARLPCHLGRRRQRPVAGQREHS